MENYLDINKESWNNRLESHLNSDFYELDAFIEGKSSLNSIELDLLGNVKGLSILHLQCPLRTGHLIPFQIRSRDCRCRSI